MRCGWRSAPSRQRQAGEEENPHGNVDRSQSRPEKNVLDRPVRAPAFRSRPAADRTRHHRARLHRAGSGRRRSPDRFRAEPDRSRRGGASPMILGGKTAVVYGAGGAVGGAVAGAFAAEGAKVFLAGRSEAPLAAVATAIAAKGGRAE